MNRRRSLDKIDTYDSKTGDLIVIVETPKQSRSKYAYDPESGTFELKFVLPEDTYFPVDFGFLPSTLGDDGDPLDVILLLDESLAVGTKVRVRLVGAIKAKERDQGQAWERNDRLIAVATHAYTYEHAQGIADVDRTLLIKIENFFKDYNRLHGKEFKVKDILDSSDAEALVKKGIKLFAAQS